MIEQVREKKLEGKPARQKATLTRRRPRGDAALFLGGNSPSCRRWAIPLSIVSDPITRARAGDAVISKTGCWSSMPPPINQVADLDHFVETRGNLDALKNSSHGRTTCFTADERERFE